MMTKKKAIILLVIIGLVLYFNSLFNGFVWDDEEQIINNTILHSIRNWPSFFLGGGFNSGGAPKLSGIFYKPLMTLTFSLLYSFFGATPFFYHLTSLALHIANSILVFLIFNLALARFSKKGNALWPTFFPALIFLVHPLYSEVVLYASDIQDVLYFFFGAMALFITMEKDLSPKKWVIISLLFLSSLLSKETGTVFLGLAVLWGLLFDSKKIGGTISAATTALGVYAFMRFGLAGIVFNQYQATPITNLSLPERLANIPKILLYYLQTFLFPQNLVPNQYWVIPTVNFQEFFLPAIFLSLFFGAIFIDGLWLWERKSQSLRPYLFFTLWFFMAISIHIQIIPLDATVSGRWFYLPAVGLLGLISTIFYQFSSRLSSAVLRIAGVVLLIIITLLSIRTFVREFDWRSGLTLYGHDILITPDNYSLENNYGVELFRIGKFNEAGKHFENSVKLAPNWWPNWNNLGAIEEKKGNTLLAERYYTKAIENGQYYLAYENLANIYFIQGKFKEVEKFTQDSLIKLPQNPKLWFILALTEYQLGKEGDALVAAKNAYFLNPNNQTGYVYQQLLSGNPLNLKAGN